MALIHAYAIRYLVLWSRHGYNRRVIFRLDTYFGVVPSHGSSHYLVFSILNSNFRTYYYASDMLANILDSEDNGTIGCSFLRNFKDPGVGRAYFSSI